MIAPAEPRRRRLPALVLVLVALVGGACGRSEPRSTPAPATTTTPAAPEPTTTDAGPTTTIDTALSPEQARTIEGLKAQVSEIRGLPWKADLPIRLLSARDLADRVRQMTHDDLVEHSEEVQASEDFLKLVGLFPKDLDYVATLDKVLASGTLGFYDDEAKELFVGANPNEDLGPAAKSTMAHELTHALTDQHFEFGKQLTALVDAGRTEESFALSALVEGDAERVREAWADSHLTAKERRRAVETEIEGADPSAFLSAPPYLLSAITFPYLQGLDFVRTIADAGGNAAVDAAYRQPPTSSEEIIHPGSFAPGRQWGAPEIPDVAAAAGCQAVDTGNVGEFDMSQLLGRGVDGNTAAKAAAGWNGDAYRLVRCGSDIAFVDRWKADSPGDLDELASALAAWGADWSGSSTPTGGDGGFAGPNGAGRVTLSGDRVDLVVAADASTADRLALALRAS